MTLSQQTKKILSEVNTASHESLQRSMDLGVLLELANQNENNILLDDLAFSAKFICKSFDLMKRVGKGGEGYEKLESEFTSQTERSRGIIATLLKNADAITRSHFSMTYLSMDTIAMQNLMQLFFDLSWYKNYQIDSR